MSISRRNRLYPNSGAYKGSRSEEMMTINYVLSDFITKTAYFSLAAAAFVFVSMLMMTGLHP
jgi:hypothetical protein